jgi:hypothetical protein
MSQSANLKEIILPEYTNFGKQQVFEWGMRAVTIELDVLNEPIYYSLFCSATGESSRAQWEQEVYVAPQHRTITRQGIFGIRFRATREYVSLEEANPLVCFEAIAEEESYPVLSQLLK